MFKSLQAFRIVQKQENLNENKKNNDLCVATCQYSVAASLHLIMIADKSGLITSSVLVEHFKENYVILL